MNRLFWSWLFILGIIVFHVGYCVAIDRLMGTARAVEVNALMAGDLSQNGLDLFINEFCASNNVIRDPHGEYEDWIELYNGSSRAVDIGGMYLTDDLENPTKWRIPDKVPALTTVGSKGYVVIWADNDTEQSGLHASF